MKNTRDQYCDGDGIEHCGSAYRLPGRLAQALRREKHVRFQQPMRLALTPERFIAIYSA
jgi:hypothetical protein